ncbi:DUF1242-domain-containing protein, partial [Pseudovirgaria hyperparasitica]
TAFFNFQSLLLVILLTICTSTYAHYVSPGIMDRNKDGALGIFWKCARIGERLSPYVSICCVVMAVCSPPQVQPRRDIISNDKATHQASIFLGQ